MMKYSVVLSFVLSVLVQQNSNAQAKTELRNTFYEAESWFLYEDYREALPLYLTLLRIYPQNANIKYRIGQCYLNMPGEKEKSITYLEDAVKSISPGYKKGKFSETKAPYDALFFLANAYLINNKLDIAYETFSYFQKNLNPLIYDTAIVRLQIKSCINAKSMLKKPVYLKEQNLGDHINQKNSEFNPVISDDEKMLVFTRSYPFYDALLYTIRDESGSWTEPVNMNQILDVDNYLYPTSISHDGKDLYLYSAVDYDGIIYKTRYENGKWSPLEKLNDNINTKFWESHATISHDNKKLFFTSNRKGTYGELDIYVSERDSSGRWGPARNLGPEINTPYNEESPFLSQDDNTLYFSSRGHYGMGGYDYFYSTLLADGQWSVPLNVGYPMNSTDDDVFFRPINDGYQGYVARYNPRGFGKQDIYKVELFSDEHPRKFIARGIAKPAFSFRGRTDRIEIIARDPTAPEKKPVVIKADPETGGFVFSLPHGNYELTYNLSGATSQKRNIFIPIESPSDTIIIPVTILARADKRAFLSIIGSKNRLVRKPDPVAFLLKAEPGGMLEIRKWNGKKLISNQKITVKDSMFTYMLKPLKGSNMVAFRLTDSNKNTASENVNVTYRESRTTAVVQKRAEPPNIATTASYSGISNTSGFNTLVSLQIPVRVNEKTSFYAGLGRSWTLIAAAGSCLILFFLLYYRKRKNRNRERTLTPQELK